MSTDMIDDLAATSGRIKRHRYSAREQDAKESAKVIARRGQHECNCLAQLQAVLLQSGGDSSRLSPEHAIRHDLVVSLAADRYRRELGVLADMP